MSVTLSKIRALNAVAEAGSFAAAARLLNISQPAVSRQIKELEGEYVVRLFERTNGQLRPTPLCAELCDIAERMAEAERNAERLLGRRNTLVNGRLTIGLGNSMPGMALIAAFHKQYPGVEISVETGSFENIISSVITREVDVGVLPNVPNDGRFRKELLIRQSVVAIVHPDHPAGKIATLNCKRLMQEPLIFRSKGSSTQRVVDRAFQAAELIPSPLLTLDTRDTVYEAVANGLGIGFMWRNGTGRTDVVRRVPVSEMHKVFEEVAFTLATENSMLLEAFFMTVTSFRNDSFV